MSLMSMKTQPPAIRDESDGNEADCFLQLPRPYTLWHVAVCHRRRPYAHRPDRVPARTDTRVGAQLQQGLFPTGMTCSCKVTLRNHVLAYSCRGYGPNGDHQQGLPTGTDAARSVHRVQSARAWAGHTVGWARACSDNTVVAAGGRRPVGGSSGGAQTGRMAAG